MLCGVLVCGATGVHGQEQYPKPLIHTPKDHPAERVIVLSVDGLHALDLELWVAAHPASTLTMLSRRGVTYTNAHLPWDNLDAGMMAMATGGTPLSTGILSLDFPGSGDAPVHTLLRDNTIFELVHDGGGATAWAGENAQVTDLLRGPSGTGLSEATVETSDDACVSDVLRWIDGPKAPVLFGMNFSALAAAQRAPGAYVDALSTPSPALEKTLEYVDDSVGRMVTELKAKGMFDSTWFVITAAYAQSPMDDRPRRHVAESALRAVLKPGSITSMTVDGVAMIWLKDPAQADAVVKAFAARRMGLGIDTILTGKRLELTVGSRTTDGRMPDIVLAPADGVIWGSTAAARTGIGEDDTHVAVLVSGVQLTGRTDPTPIPTSQIPAMLLRTLGMEKLNLQALHREHSPALPGIF